MVRAVYRERPWCRGALTGSVAADQRPIHYRPGDLFRQTSDGPVRSGTLPAMPRRSPRAPQPDARTPDPRLAQLIIGAVLAGQALYAGASILVPGTAPATPGGDGVPAVLVTGAFVAYVAAIPVYFAGILRAQRWLRPLAMGIAAAGLLIAAVRVAGGHPLDDLLFGMGIDGLLLYGLRRPDIRRLYPA